MEVKQCLNCGKSVNQEKGKREKIFCSDGCRAAYYLKTHPKERKYVQTKTHEAVIEKYEKEKSEREAYIKLLESNIKQLEAQISTQSQNKVSVQNLTETAKTSNYSINTVDKHPLWKPGDPKENSAAFIMRYNVANYDELEKSQKQ